MKRRRERNIQPDVEPHLPMDMLRVIASHSDIITARLLRRLCRATENGILPVAFNLEEWVAAIPEAHDCILREARHYILNEMEGPGPVEKTVFWSFVLKYWTNRERFNKDQGALNVIHFAQTHFLNAEDDQWALQYIWVMDNPFWLCE